MFIGFSIAIVLVVLAVVLIAVLHLGTGLWAEQERNRVEHETRFAQWRLQQATSVAMQRLLDEARRRQ